MQQFQDEIGLPVDGHDALQHPPSIIVYGRTGGGKSTELAKAFPRCFYLLSSPTVLRPVVSWTRENPELASSYGLSPGTLNAGLRSLTIPQVDVRTGKLLDPRPLIDHYVNAIWAAQVNGTSPYDGIILDEFTDFCVRVAQIEQSKGYSNKYAWSDITKAWIRKIGALPRSVNFTIGMVCHEVDPHISTKGEWSPGGPALALHKLRNEVAGMVDIVLRRKIRKVSAGAPPPAAPSDGEVGGPPPIGGLQEQTERYWLTGGDPDWLTKFRDFSISEEEKGDLRELLTRSGIPLRAG